MVVLFLYVVLFGGVKRGKGEGNIKEGKKKDKDTKEIKKNQEEGQSWGRGRQNNP